MSFKKIIPLYIVIVFFLPISYIHADTNSEDTNSIPEYQIEPSSTNSGKNIIFDSYDEVIMQNFEKQHITQIKFIGNVKIRFDNNTLKARTVIITTASNKVTDISAFEKVEFRYGQDVYLADFMSFNPETKKGILKKVRSYVKSSGSSSGTGTMASPISLQGGWYYHAEKATILSETRVVLEDVYFTFTPSEFPAYHFYAQRLWYFKDEMIFALNDTYTVGQANFIYFPFFIRWEKYTGIRTAFGQEERIGWYMMNSLTFNLPSGSYEFGLDFYERLGQYFMMNYSLKQPFGVIQTLNLAFQGANDMRIFRDTSSGNDRFTYIDSQNSNYINTQQLSWQYNLNSSLKFNDILLSLNWEDLNDPFFVSKYKQRRYDFNIMDVLQPINNQFFLHDDRNIEKSEIDRSFDLKYNTLDINGSWRYQLNEDPSVSNRYLNERYKYYLTNISFPNISYSPGQIELLKDAGYSYPISKTIELSNKKYEIPVEQNSDSYIDNILLNRTNTSDQPNNTQDNTNNQPVSIENTPGLISLSNKPASSPASYRISTNNLELYNFASYFNNINFNYNSQEYVDTNNMPTYDHYSHTESGDFVFNGAFLNRFIYWNNDFSLKNYKYWSSFDFERTNNINSSGMILSLSTSLGFTQNPSIFTGSPWQINFPYNVSHVIYYDILRSTGSLIPSSDPLKYSHTTSLSSGFNLLENNINYSLSLQHSMTFRNTNGIDDVYIDNMIARTFSIDTHLVLYWVSFSTGTAFDLLETKTNVILFTFDSLTNRIQPGYNPILTVQFSPPQKFQPLPSITYLYDILKKTNEKITFSSTYSISDLYTPIIYWIESLSFTSSLNWDFLSPRSTLFLFNINTAFWLDRYWKLSFSTGVKNQNIFRYFQENRQYFAQGETYVDFWQNLWDSINIFNYEGLKRGFFKIQDLNFTLTHYLNEWRMDIAFNIARRVDTTRQIAYWEPSIRIVFTLGDSSPFPPYEKKFVPAQYQ